MRILIALAIALSTAVAQIETPVYLFISDGMTSIFYQQIEANDLSSQLDTGFS